MASKDKDKNPTGTYRSRSGGIRTLAYLNRHTGPGSDSDPIKHYTGGNKSDRMVQDPTKGNDVDGILDQAKQMGAVEKPFDMYTPPSSRSLSGPAAPQPVPVSHDIVFWHNGFTVNNGPLRRIDDPRNASFLTSVKNSECPKELEPADKRTTVHVNLVKKGESYVEPRRTRRRVGLQGKGRSVGSRPSKSAFSFTPFVPAPPPPPAFSLVIDETKPTTCIELRLADGTRMIGCFNHHHTINDIRGFIDSSRPGQTRNYELHAVWFTPKLLNDPNQTIEQAGLANSVVIQKL